MALRLDALGPYQTLLYTTRAEIFFSYGTPVAARINGRGYVRTAHSSSPTTTKHIETWLGGIELQEIVDQSVLYDLLT